MTQARGAYSQSFEESIYEMHSHRTRAIRERGWSGEVQQETLIQLENAVITVFYALRPHVLGGQHPELEALWEEHNVDTIADNHGRKQVKENENSAYGRVISSKDTSVEHYDLRYLLGVSAVFDQIAKRLGLAPQTSGGARPKGTIG